MPMISALPESNSEEVGGNGQLWLKDFPKLRAATSDARCWSDYSTTLFLGTGQDIFYEKGIVSSRILNMERVLKIPEFLAHLKTYGG